MDEYSRHPIQLIYLGVRELAIRTNVPPDQTIEANAEKVSISIYAPSKFDPSEPQFSVGVILEAGSEPPPDKEEDPKDPFHMRIELRGYFSVDTARFAPEHVLDWAGRGAIYVLMPFLREHAYSLSGRAGFRPLLLPLVEVPTFKVFRDDRGRGEKDS